MLLRRFALATLLPAAFAAAQQGGAATATLAPELRPGENFVFTVSVESASRFEDAKKNVSMVTCLTFTATVGERELDATKVECRLDRLRLRATAPNVSVDYDSAAPLPDSGPLQTLRELTGSVFTLEVSATGEVTAVEKPRLLDKAAEDSIGADFRTLFSAWFVALPHEPMAIGTSWNGSSKLFGVMPGNAATPTTYRLAAVDRSQALVTAIYQPAAPTTRPGVMFEIRQSEGSMTIDLERRRIVRTEARLLARATRSKGSETATSTIVMCAAEGAEDPDVHGVSSVFATAE